MEEKIGFAVESPAFFIHATSADIAGVYYQSTAGKSPGKKRISKIKSLIWTQPIPIYLSS